METTLPTTLPGASGGNNTSVAAQGNTSAAVQGNAALSSDFETFLKMLTAQMRNQDPLNPVESADFAVQLATFSTVEQQVRTNDLLVSLSDRIGALNLGQFSGWIGLSARAAMPVNFDGAPVQIFTHTAENADRAELVVHDSQSAEVQRISLELGESELNWAGVDEDGNPLPSGEYAVTVESFANGELLGSNQVEVSGKITEARSVDGQTILVMESGQTVLASEIKALGASGP